MKIQLFQVDAFTDALFRGNPAAVCPLPYWLSDDMLRAIANENNLSETSFFVPVSHGFELRWFTPEDEVDLCGHATLATAHVLFEHLDFDGELIQFATRSGILEVRKQGDLLAMDFPATLPELCPAPETLIAALGIEPLRVYKAFDYVCEYESAMEVRAITPDMQALCALDGRGVVVTAPADAHSNADFVSRCFYPKLRVDEDPVTGSAHCQLAPLWAKTLKKDALTGYQDSERGGFVYCQMQGERVVLKGKVVDYLAGYITLQEKQSVNEEPQ
ncbi:MAG: PhzF family phenazine biosynthesis protein [Idiomarina sp.]|nr:PhzF family phenazine biosynthesis protein [Idiomarina sp.]